MPLELLQVSCRCSCGASDTASVGPGLSVILLSLRGSLDSASSFTQQLLNDRWRPQSHVAFLVPLTKHKVSTQPWQWRRDESATT